MTFILAVIAIGTTIFCVMVGLDWLEQKNRSRERAAMRRLVDYMNLIPRRERRPW